MKEMTLAEQFRAFVFMQPEDRPINHISFEHCAVGDFCREVKPELVNDEAFGLVLYCSDHAAFDPPNRILTEFHTYGELQRAFQG